MVEHAALVFDKYHVCGSISYPKVLKNGTRKRTAIKPNFEMRNGTPFLFFKGTDTGTETNDQIFRNESYSGVRLLTFV